MATQGNNQLEKILKSFIQEIKNQFQDQRVSIKKLENQVGEISYALNLRPIGALPSFTKIPPFTSGTKSIKTCKVISLKSGKEYEGLSLQNTNQPNRNMKSSDESNEEQPNTYNNFFG